MANQNAFDSFEGWHAPLLELWRRFLKADTVSIDNDFFEMGGDSMLAMDMLAELQRLTGARLPESLISDAPTVRALAVQLARVTGRSGPKSPS
jgi:acyl carrier protein